MKTQILPAILSLLFTIFIFPPLLAIDVNQPSGTVSLHSGYVDNMSQEWNINTSVGKMVKVTYSIDTEEDCDFANIYDIDNAGIPTLLATITGNESGFFYSKSKSGKIKVSFTSDDSYSYNEGYAGFDIQFAPDERTDVSNGLNVSGDAYFYDNTIMNGRLAIGTTPRSRYKLNIENTTGEAAALLAYSNTPYTCQGIESYAYSSAGYAYGIRTSAYTSSNLPSYGLYASSNSSSGNVYGIYASGYSPSSPVYGIYSSVSGGAASKKWAGYFTGGTVEINDGKLHLNGKAATVQTTNAGMITFWDDARFTVTNSIIPSLRTASYSMTNYGMAAVPVTGGADLWLSGYSGIRMFTGAVAVPRFNITNDGNVGIGTTNPQYKLDVKGQIRATEVLVQGVDQFADFVFDKDYRLPSLHEVNTFIQDNGHLPGIPSAQEVKDKGMSLVEMQVKLLQKVEELTLYSIRQQEEIKALKDELNTLKKK